MRMLPLLLFIPLMACATAEAPILQEGDLVQDADAAIEIGRKVCRREQPHDPQAADWRAVLHEGVWDVWYDGPHCSRGHLCPTFSVKVSAADGSSQGCTIQVGT